MTSKILVVPDDLTIEIEALSRKGHRSEDEVLREAIQHYLAFLDAGKALVAFEQFLDSAPNVSLDSTANEKQRPIGPSAPPTMPKSFGIASSGRVQADKFDEWLAANWERDW